MWKILVYFFQKLFSFHREKVETTDEIPKYTFSDYDNRDFIKLVASQAPSIDNSIKLQQLFIAPHEAMQALQLQAVRILMQKISALYIPRRLHVLLKDYDAIYAVKLFLDAIFLSYEELLKDKEKRKLLNKILSLLVHIDIARKDLGLSDIAFYPLIQKRDWYSLEKMIDKFEKVCEMVNFLKAKTIPFPEYYQEFYLSAGKALKLWYTLDDNSFKVIYIHYQKWQKINQQYQEKLAEINTITNKITQKIGQHSALNPIYQSIENVKEKIQQYKISPQQALQELDKILKVLLLLYKKLLQEEKQEDKKQQQSKQQNSNQASELLKILGLSYPKDLNLATIKNAYRRLAMQHHPDRGGDAEKFKQIQYAYTELQKYIL